LTFCDLRSPRSARLLAAAALRSFGERAATSERRLKRRRVRYRLPCCQLADAKRAPQRPPAERLRALFAESDAAMLRRNPIAAIGRGDYTNADQLGTHYSDDMSPPSAAAVEQDLATLRASTARR
jgi:hypothetical protein